MRQDVGVVKDIQAQEYTHLTQQQLVERGGDMDSGKDLGDGSKYERL